MGNFLVQAKIEFDAAKKEFAGAQERYNSFVVAQRAEALADVKTIISDFGFTAADLGLTPPPATEIPKPAPKNKTAVADKAIAGTVYVHPADPTITWTGGGKGQRPKWLKDLLATGKTFAELAQK